MFEQAVIRPPRVRGWAVTVGFAGELAFVACVFAAPLIWPQLLPKAAITSWLTAPLPPAAVSKAPRSPRARQIREWPAGPFYQPISVHLTPPVLPAPQLDQAPDLGVPGGVEVAENSPGRVWLDSVIRQAPPARPATPPPPTNVQRAAAAETRTIRVGGNVQAALLVHRVDPVYPPTARQMRVSGTVELNGLIGFDGRIRELRVASGHPLLAPAALDAVRQWVYRPTLLGGEPVEVITTITVVFRLN